MQQQSSQAAASRCLSRLSRWAAMVAVAGARRMLGVCGQAALPDAGREPVKGPLSILLVNDDGWDAPGITAVYECARRKAGHRVTLVAPLENQSGSSMSTTSEKLAVTRPVGDEPKYAVDGTPVDALNVGLLGVLKDDRPDIVVSGVNMGANMAQNTNYSGTVGAAAAAAQQGVPALAVSADVGGPSGSARLRRCCGHRRRSGRGAGHGQDSPGSARPDS